MVFWSQLAIWLFGYLRCDMRLLLHQYLSSSRCSILSCDSELRCGVTSSLALLKTRSTSADTAGIKSRSMACCADEDGDEDGNDE